MREQYEKTKKHIYYDGIMINSNLCLLNVWVINALLNPLDFFVLPLNDVAVIYTYMMDMNFTANPSLAHNLPSVLISPHKGILSLLNVGKLICKDSMIKSILILPLMLEHASLKCPTCPSSIGTIVCQGL